LALCACSHAAAVTAARTRLRGARGVKGWQTVGDREQRHRSFS